MTEQEQERDERLTGGSRSIEHHWWVQAPAERDVYLVFLVRYSKKDDEYTGQEYWHDGNWHKYEPYEILKPAMVLDGMLVYAMAQAGALERGTIADSLTKLAERIWEQAQEGIE